MLDEFDRELKRALKGSHLGHPQPKLVECGVTVEVVVGRNTTQPFTVVIWSMEVSACCLVTLSPALANTGRIEFIARRLAAVFPLLDAYYQSCGTEPHRGVYLNLEDHTVLPGLSFCARDTNSFLIPDPVFLESHGYAELREQIAAMHSPWPDRRPLAIWRGATTGPTEAVWRNLPRIRLCVLGAAHPELIDTGISSVVQLREGADAEIRAAGLMRDAISAPAFVTWRYQIDIDGNTNSWPGLYQKLLTGSAVIKVASPGRWRQWYYDRLVPWHNFVPAAADLSDMVERVEWLRAHDDAAREIGARGRELALSLDYETEVAAAVPVMVAAMTASRLSRIITVSR